MAPKAYWKGYLKLSLVSCPVQLYPATTSTEKISFNLLHKDTLNRVRMVPTDPELGPVERADLVKGYPVDKDRYVVVEDCGLPVNPAIVEGRRDHAFAPRLAAR